MKKESRKFVTIGEKVVHARNEKDQQIYELLWLVHTVDKTVLS